MRVLLWAIALLISGPAFAQTSNPSQFRLTDGETDQDAEIHQIQGPVRVAFTAALVAPRKTNGCPWDGMGACNFAEEASAGLPKPLIKQVFGVLRRGLNPLGILGEALPWTINAFSRGVAAPDVQVYVSMNEQPILTALKVPNDYVPFWSRAWSAPLQLGPESTLQFEAWDVDLSQDDQIGGCTIRGNPSIDKDGYVLANHIRCYGQLWAIAVRLVPAGDSVPQETQVPQSRRAQPSPTSEEQSSAGAN
jgi:hypothetical protein